MVGWVQKSDREARKCERMINDRRDQDRRSIQTTAAMVTSFSTAGWENGNHLLRIF